MQHQEYQRAREREYYGYGDQNAHNEYLAGHGNNSNRSRSQYSRQLDSHLSRADLSDSNHNGSYNGSSGFTGSNYTHSHSQVGRKKLNSLALDYLDDKRAVRERRERGRDGQRRRSSVSDGSESDRNSDRSQNGRQNGYINSGEDDHEYSDLSDLDRNCDGYSKNEKLNSVLGHGSISRASEMQLPSSQASEFSEGELLRMQFSRDFGRDIREAPILKSESFKF